MSAGPLELTVTLGYLDDFNQQQIVVKQLSVEVGEAFQEPGFESGGEGEISVEEPQAPVGFWQSLWRAILGLLGLDSGSPEPAEPTMPEGFPGEEMPPVPAIPLG